MGVKAQKVTGQYAVYNGDCIEVMQDLPEDSIHFSVYSPPFCGLYHYSSSPRDLSNCNGRESFLEHYRYVVHQLFRLTKKGRCSAVHVTDIPSGNSGRDYLVDFPGDVIRLHEQEGWHYIGRHCIWKEPLTVRNRTMQKNLAHKTLVEDSIYCGVASADFLLMFRRKGKNEVPVSHATGLSVYYGERKVPPELFRWRGWKGSQIENRYSHWIWRQYASSFWDDIRLDNVLPYIKAREEDDEKHVHPLQLDVIHRAIVLRSNPGEVVMTPFMGVGSEVYAAVKEGRKGVGIELKPSYYKQTLRNLDALQETVKRAKKEIV